MDVGETRREPKKSALEIRKFDLDEEIRRGELNERRAEREANERNQVASNDLKRRELELSASQGLRFTTAQATIAAALLSLASGVMGGLIQAIMTRDVEYRKTDAQISIEGRKVDAQITVEKLKADSEIKLARDKLDFDQRHDVKQFESTLILNATKSENIADRIRNLRFFVKAELLLDKDGKIMTLIESGDVPISQNRDRIIGERQCPPDEHWVYSQSTGLLCRGGLLFGEGYSGNGTDENNPDAQSHHQTGPLPQGTYTIEAPITFKSMTYVLPLSPDPGNEMFGRGGFLIRDGVFTGETHGMTSMGTIALPEAVRVVIWNSGDHILHVVR